MLYHQNRHYEEQCQAFFPVREINLKTRTPIIMEQFPSVQPAWGLNTDLEPANHSHLVCIVLMNGREKQLVTN